MELIILFILNSFKNLISFTILILNINFNKSYLPFRKTFHGNVAVPQKCGFPICRLQLWQLVLHPVSPGSHIHVCLYYKSTTIFVWSLICYEFCPICSLAQVNFLQLANDGSIRSIKSRKVEYKNCPHHRKFLQKVAYLKKVD
jgi:hypothetical protein